MRVASMAMGLSRWIGEGAQAALGDELVDEVDDLLRAPHREGGDEQHAAAGEGALQHAFELLVDRHRGVRAVAVRALHHHVVGVGRELGVLGDHRVEAAHVAAEQRSACADPFSATVRSTEAAPSRWPASRKRKEKRFETDLARPRGTRLERAQAGLDVRGVEQGQRGLVLAQALAVQVLGVLFLQVGRVLQQDLGQLAGGAACRRCGP